MYSFFRISIVLGLILGALPIMAANGSRFVVQVGAFKSEEEAAGKAAALQDPVLNPVRVQQEETGDKGFFYKVFVGDFESRAEAEKAKADLRARGVFGYVRAATSFDVSAVRAALNGPAEDFFTTGSQPLARIEAFPTLPASLALMRKSAFSGTSTAPAVLRAAKSYIEQIPDDHPAKGQDIVYLAHLTLSGKSAYSGQKHDLTAVKQMLSKVANGEIAALPRDRDTARFKIAHILHYYDHDYVNALKAYKQLLADQITYGRAANVAKMRMEVASTSYELAKRSGYDRGELLVPISMLWDDAVLHQQDFLSTNTQEAKDVREFTSRIGLMLSEILMEQQQWEQAKELAARIVDSYSEFEETQGEVAEAYSHLAHIGIELNDKDLCYSSADAAIEILKNTGTVWGDPNRDVLWKAYAWKNVASYRFNEPQAVRNRIKAEMIALFPNHPGIETYFGGVVEP